MGGTCERHEGNGIVGKCSVCGKGTCRECREEFGYFCSQECLERSRGSVDSGEKERTRQRLEQGLKLDRILSLSFKVAGALLLLCIAYFAWSLFLSPYGKLAWSWNGEISEKGFFRLDPKGSKLLILKGPFATVFDAAKGVPVAGAKGDEIQRLDSFSGRLGSSSLLHGDSCFGLLTDDCAFTWFKDLKGQRLVSLAFDQERVVALLSKGYAVDDEAKDAKEPSQPLSLLCLRASDGSLVWSRPLPSGESATGLCAADGRFAYSAAAIENGEYAQFLKVCSLASGEPQWQVKLKGHSYLPPFFAEESLVFASSGFLNAVASDGSGKLWSLKLGEGVFLSESSMKLSGSKLLVQTSKGLACVDLKGRKVAWERSLDCNVWDLHVDGGKAFMLGSIRESPSRPSSEEKPATLEELKDSELTPAGLMGKAANGFKSNAQTLMALDIKDGKELWRKEKAVGRLVCGDGRLALLVDTAKDLMISAIGGSLKGEMGVTQLSPSSGEKIASGSDKAGLGEPFAICGDKLIGVAYDRDSSVCALGMGKAPPIRILGLAAFKLK